MLILQLFIWKHVSGLMRFLTTDRSNSVSTFVGSFFRLLPTMQPCPGLSLVMRAGFTVMTLRRSKSLKSPRQKKGMAGDKGIAHKEFVLAGHTW
jgi:hypothetical protein